MLESDSITADNNRITDPTFGAGEASLDSDMTDTGDWCDYKNPECYAKYCVDDEPMCKAIKTKGAKCGITYDNVLCWLRWTGIDCTGLTWRECDAAAF